MPDLPPMNDYEATRRDFGFRTPEYYNFGFDLVDRRAREADKVAFIAVDRSGERIESHRFSDLSGPRTALPARCWSLAPERAITPW